MRWFGISLLLLSTTYGQDVFFPGEVPANFKPTAVNINVRQSFTSRSSSPSSATCSTPAGERGTCGPLSRCGSFLPYVRQLNNPTVNQFFRERICRSLVFTVHVCCPVKNPILPFANSNPQPVPQPQPPSIIPTEAVCGSPGGSRITSGKEVQPGNWPWLTVLGKRSIGNEFLLTCGGTLITIRHVLTAEHCFSGNKNTDPDLVRLGEHHLDNDIAGERPEEFRIANRRTNNYNRQTNENDIALLILDRDVSFNHFIRPACLPFNHRNEEFDDQALVVVGWGKTETHLNSKVPMEAHVVVVPQNECVSAYQYLLNKSVIDNRQLCAGIGVQDSCNGDSGGPLTYLDLKRGRYYLIGIVSSGAPECGDYDYPGVYTRVSSFLDWIQQNVQ